MSSTLNINPFVLGDRARDRRDWPRALSLYREALTVSSEEAALWVQYGHACKEVGLVAAAEAAYLRAMVLSPRDGDVRVQLGHLYKLAGDRSAAIKCYREGHILSDGAPHARNELIALGEPLPRSNDIRFDDRALFIDVGDVVRFAQSFSRPSGIQRVQMSVVDALREELDVARVILLVMRTSSGRWVHVSGLAMRALSLSMRGDTTEDMRIDRETAMEVFEKAPEVRWPRGCTYLMLGTAWDNVNDASSIGALKAQYGLRVAAFLHDLVPITHPRMCVPGLPYRFERWLTQALTVTDKWVSNSEHTAKSLIAFAQQSGLPAPSVTATPLDARLQLNALDTQTQADGAKEVAKVLGFDPRERPFVLNVGTIEPRKNHLTLLSAWRKVCAHTHAPPALVLAGKVGWSASASILEVKRAQSDGLDVHHVSGLSDAGIEALYASCMLMVYPSVHEGWGLPITEALSHGKIVVVGRHSGVSEAAGNFGHYVDIENADALAEALLLLVNDEPMRRTLEAKIRKGFKPRAWREIAPSIVDAAFSQK